MMPPAPPGDRSLPMGDGDMRSPRSGEMVDPRPRKARLLRHIPRQCVVTTGDASANALYLTFDDGPHPAHTPRLLDLLAAHGARATFFLIGANVQRHPALARRIAEEGHALGNHSWDHPHFEQISRSDRMAQITRTEALLEATDGKPRHDFRPPRGVATPGLLLDCALRGTRMAYWSYDSLDYSQRDPGDLLANIAAHPVRSGDIVLMHDDSPHSYTMLSTLLPQWRAQGHTFRALEA